MTRIARQEQAFDQAQDFFNRLESFLEEAQQIKPLLAGLEAYYETDWRSDVEADEQGQLPADLKRGVLSEDGLYNLLTDQVVLVIDLRELADQLAPSDEEQPQKIGSKWS